jgi:hypothetical protein
MRADGSNGHVCAKWPTTDGTGLLVVLFHEPQPPGLSLVHTVSGGRRHPSIQPTVSPHRGHVVSAGAVVGSVANVRPSRKENGSVGRVVMAGRRFVVKNEEIQFRSDSPLKEVPVAALVSDYGGWVVMVVERIAAASALPPDRRFPPAPQKRRLRPLVVVPLRIGGCHHGLCVRKIRQDPWTPGLLRMSWREPEPPKRHMAKHGIM